MPQNGGAVLIVTCAGAAAGAGAAATGTSAASTSAAKVQLPAASW